MGANASVSIRTLFAPFDDTTGEFLSFIQGTKESLFVVIYGFHLPKLSDALIAAHKAGLEVGVILDHSQAEGKAEQAEVQKLLAAGVPILIGTSPVHRQILHSKFTVRDGKAVEFGSWNYSLSASQQSNTMSFVEDAGYAQQFLRHYDRIRSFLLLHEMAIQPAGEVAAPEAIAGDDAAASPESIPATTPANGRAKAAATHS